MYFDDLPEDIQDMLEMLPDEADGDLTMIVEIAECPTMYFYRDGDKVFRIFERFDGDINHYSEPRLSDESTAAYWKAHKDGSLKQAFETLSAIDKVFLSTADFLDTWNGTQPLDPDGMMTVSVEDMLNIKQLLEAFYSDEKADSDGRYAKR